MKKGIHPKYYDNVEVTCSCGHKFTTGSTIEGPIKVEICAKCHPFFTGKSKFIDTKGRIERFVEKQEKAKGYKKKAKHIKTSKK